MASAEILARSPISGVYPEKQFDAFGNTAWVKFMDDNYEEWCGVFGAGENSANAVVLSLETTLAFVIAGGQGYFVDSNSRSVLHKTRSDRLKSAKFVPGSAHVIACDLTDIFAIGLEGVIWTSGRVSLDGITFGEISSERLTGLVTGWSDEGVEFILEFNPFSYTCSWTFDC